MLTQLGGDRWAAAAPIRAAIAAALGAAPDDEIREAFGLAEWRAVTAEHRARYGEYFQPKVYRALVEAMRSGLGGWGDRLAIKDFAVFKREEMAEELFPVTKYGPCIAADMFEVDVTISAGADDSVSVKGLYEGRWARWHPEHGNIIEGFPAEYYGVAFGADGDYSGYFVVPGQVSLVMNYSGFIEKTIKVVEGLIVKGVAVKEQSPSGGEEDYWRLQVSDPAPNILGRVDVGVPLPIGFGGPYQEWVLGRPYFTKTGLAFSKFAIDSVSGKSAEGLLKPGAVHDVNSAGDGIPQKIMLGENEFWNYGGYPLGAENWAGCFPRKKKICRVQVGGVEHFEVVDWISRAQWVAWYGAGMAQWVASGAVVPRELVGERYPGGRIYATFAPSFVAAINEAPE